MTEQEKSEQLASIAERAAITDSTGNHSTAKSWRDLYATVAARPADEMILAATRAAKPTNPV